MNFTTKAITEWTERARKYPGYQPRANWAGEMAEAIRGAEGRVVTLITSEAWDIHELRKPWNRGQYELIPKSAERTLSAYVAAGTELPKVGEYWITSAQPGREWPPEDIPMFLGFVEVARPLPKMLSP